MRVCRAIRADGSLRAGVSVGGGARVLAYSWDALGSRVGCGAAGGAQRVFCPAPGCAQCDGRPDGAPAVPADAPPGSFGTVIQGGFFPARTSGVYCAACDGGDAPEGVVFEQAHGRLPAERYALLPLHAWLFWVHAACLLVWGVFCWRRRRGAGRMHTAAVAPLALGAAASAVLWLHHRCENASPDASPVVLALAVLLSALRTAAVQRLVLLVSLGWGTVPLSTGSLSRALCLAAGQCAAIFLAEVTTAGLSIASLANAKARVVLCTLPAQTLNVAVALWTLSAASNTIPILALRGEGSRTTALRALRVLCGLLAILSTALWAGTVCAAAGASEHPAWVSAHWRALWLWTSGGQSIAAFVHAAGAAVILRPEQTSHTQYSPAQAARRNSPGRVRTPAGGWLRPESQPYAPLAAGRRPVFGPADSDDSLPLVRRAG